MLLHEIGTYGPILLVLITIHFLWKVPTRLFYYIVGLSINTLTNIILKNALQESRPHGDFVVRTGADSSKLQATRNPSFTSDANASFVSDKYGMPSGHAQSVAYTTAFVISSSFVGSFWDIVYLLISCVTLIQRYVDKSHTIMQLSVGVVLGCMIAFITHVQLTKAIKGDLKHKKDDESGFVLNFTR